MISHRPLKICWIGMILFESIYKIYKFYQQKFMRVSTRFRQLLCNKISKYATQSTIQEDTHYLQISRSKNIGFSCIIKLRIVCHCVKTVRNRSFSGPHSVGMRENTDQRNSEHGHFLRSGFSCFLQESMRQKFFDVNRSSPPQVFL